MPALIPTRFTGTIAWLGLVADREAALPSAPVQSMTATFAGPVGESHGGLTRPACSRVRALYPENTPIRNTRQLSVLSAEELAAIAVAMGLTSLDPALVGATLVISGIPDFTRLPPSSRLQAAGGCTLVVDMENRPCTLAARSIASRHPAEAKAFKQAAEGRRGVTAWVEREGALTLGEAVTLFIPDQPPWAHQAAARQGGSLPA